CLLLVVCCFLPFHELPGLDRGPVPDEPRRIRSLAIRLIYAEVSIVYFYTAITKVDEHWLSGWSLNRIITVEGVREMYASINAALGWTDLGMYSFVAHVIMLWQFFVAVAFIVPRLRPAACITGPIFHILVEVIDLKIGWFSYYMIGIYYLLLFPDSWFLAAARPLAPVLERGQALLSNLTRPGEPASQYMAAGTAGACAMGVYFVPAEGTVPLAVGVAAMTAAALWPRKSLPTTSALTRALANAAVVFCMVGTLRASDAPYDYYRFWGGDLARRDQVEDAAHMYERANALRGPHEPARHFQLARAYQRLGRSEDARRAYEEGLERAPDDARGRAELRALERQMGIAGSEP
ncbi:MAG: HTTM domain-containing protein, partial [Deltaproteobacteria bacterium]|nr:HTTM domain-containing protein [Deltaproteobacteria bacterium]